MGTKLQFRSNICSKWCAGNWLTNSNWWLEFLRKCVNNRGALRWIVLYSRFHFLNSYSDFMRSVHLPSPGLWKVADMVLSSYCLWNCNDAIEAFFLSKLVLCNIFPKLVIFLYSFSFVFYGTHYLIFFKGKHMIAWVINCGQKVII